MGRKPMYIYSLYDNNEIPVLITDRLKEVAVFLGRSSFNSMKVTLNKYFKRINNGLDAHLEDTKGKHYSIFKDKKDEC